MYCWPTMMKTTALFFKDAFEEIKIKTNVTLVNDGVELMNHLDTKWSSKATYPFS